jgi:hypothetical protein
MAIIAANASRTVPSGVRLSAMGLHRALIVAFVGGTLALVAPAAQAGILPTDCKELTSKIATAAADPNHGEGDVIVLNGMCDASNLKSSVGVSVPGESNFSIEGAPGTTSGFDGAGVTAPLLHSAGFETVGTITLRNLTFQHANVAAGAGSAIRMQIAHLTLANDSFIENTLHGFGGGAVNVFITAPGGKPVCQASPTPAGATVTNSVFRANKVIATNQGAGGALVIAQICENPETILEGNVFEGNAIEQSGSGEALGGAFTFEPGGETPTSLVQRGNVFDSNHIVSTSTTSNFGGGGEWTEGASLISVGDRFSRNTIAGAGSPKWSWGGGLGIINSSCEPTAATESALTNAVVAGNSIGAGSGELGGAGLYVGCSPVPTHPNHLSLFDSTVTQNTVPAGGVAGIDGNPGDQLRIINSIVAADPGGDEIGGFNGAGGALSAAFSDVCGAGGASPLGGEGNICANPRLANDGNPASFDVAETASSPTIEAGSNALVPGGLTSDFFGNPRVSAAISRPVCNSSPALGPAIVDMGAAEFTGTIARPSGVTCPPLVLVRKRSVFTFPSVAVRPKGVLALSFKKLAAGKVAVTGTFKLTRTVTAKVKGRRNRVKRTRTITYGHTTYTTRTTKNAVVYLKPTKQALALLRSHRRLRVTLAVTFTATGELASTQRKTIAVKYKRPPVKHHHH